MVIDLVNYFGILYGNTTGDQIIDTIVRRFELRVEEVEDPTFTDERGITYDPWFVTQKSPLTK